MAKRKKKKLPYRRVRAYRGQKNNQLVKKSYRGKKRIIYVYYSNLTNRRIRKEDISRDPKVQGFREAFPRRSERTRRRLRSALAEFRRAGFNPVDDSPGLKRYFSWLRKRIPRIYGSVYKQITGKLTKNEEINVRDIQDDAEARHSRRKKQIRKVSRAKKGKRG